MAQRPKWRSQDTPKNRKESHKPVSGSCFWLGLSLTFIYPGFEPAQMEDEFPTLDMARSFSRELRIRVPDSFFLFSLCSLF